MCSFDAIATSALATHGWTLLASQIEPHWLAELRERVFAEGVAGTRCLLDEPGVAAVARQLRERLTDAGVLPATAVAIQAIAFDKTPAANWKVTWHQDVMFPFARAVNAPGYELPTKKDGVDYARPPRVVLDQLLAVRIHLDDCDETNGPLRVAPGSHDAGVFKSTEIAARVERHGQVTCLARAGEALLMRPLLLHASSVATVPKHRRVLHLVFHSGEPLAERWHRAVA